MDSETKEMIQTFRNDFNDFKVEVRKGYDKLDAKLERFLLGQNINARDIAVIQVNQDTHKKDIDAAHGKIKTNETTIDDLKSQLNKTVFKVGGVVGVIATVTGVVLKLMG